MPSRRALQQLDLGLYVLIGSLSMFFMGSVLAFGIIRYQSKFPLTGVPPLLWASTGVLLAGSFMLQRALWLVRRERQAEFRLSVFFAWLAGIAFCVLQGVGLAQLMARHQASVATTNPVSGMLFVLVLMHMLHFLAGVIALTYVVRRAWQGRYDHEYHPGVKMTAIYWLFLDVVWLIMFSTFLIFA